MRFLVDQALSHRIAERLREHGHEAVHVRELGLAEADDAVILKAARDDRRVVLTQDTDFGTLLVGGAASRPSVVLFRMRTGRPEAQADVLLANLPAIQAELFEGAIAVLTEGAIRVRRLP